MPSPPPAFVLAWNRSLLRAFRLAHWIVWLAALCLGAALPCPALAGTVYLVVGSDTAIWNDGSTVDVYARHPYYPQDFYTEPTSPAYQVMDPAWRSNFKDSYGQQIKFTWWMMGGNIYRDAGNRNFPVNNTMVLHLMKQYHGDAIRQFGDELSMHYHTFIWSDYNGDGLYYWNQSQTFNECREDFDYTLAQYLLEEDVFPVSFRSGWHYMDNDWQQYLDQLLPFSMHDNWPVYIPWHTNEPINNVQDWSRATALFIPFHPATNDYQVPGTCAGWNVRSIKMQSLTQTGMDWIFAQSVGNTDQVVCIWDHLPEAFIANFTRIDSLLQTSAATYPAVKFRYCTAVEAMQRWSGHFGQEPPILTVTQAVQDQTVTFAIQSSKDLFQPRPFVAARDVFHNYTNLTSLCTLAGSNSWTLTLPISLDNLAKVGIAATDLAGNLTTRFLQFMPDDRYIDNLDPQYSDILGDWASTPLAAWGTNARVAMLTGSNAVQVRWDLPISRSGPYDLAVQVPAVTNAAGNVTFSVHSGNWTLSATNFLTALPTNQWVFIGAPFLSQSLSNYVEMTVEGANQPGTWGVADVLRVRPVSAASLRLNDLSITSIPNGILLRFAGEPGRTYQIQRSSIPGPDWVTLVSLPAPTDGLLEYADENPPPSAAFYRLLSP